MRPKICGLMMVAAIAGSLACATQAKERRSSLPPSTSKAANAAEDSEEAQLLEGEKRFQTNCGRCHAAPHKFPPRMMATIIRHMRMRAMLTEQDMRLILKYMTQ